MSLVPSQSDEEGRKRQVLVRAIWKLPRRCRDVFVLHRFAGMPLGQIAEHLGVEKKVVEARLAGALVRLNRAVEEAGDGGASEGS